MTHARFSTVKDLFDAYPSAPDDVGEADGTTASLDFVRASAAARDWQKAISFCVYLLPKRATVAWGCRSLRRMAVTFNASDERALSFAEAWVAEPEEALRGKALALGNVNDHRAPATWLALAAGWSSGSVVPPEFDAVPPEPEKTARAVRVALLMGLSTLRSPARDHVMTACLEDGIELAGGPPPQRQRGSP